MTTIVHTTEGNKEAYKLFGHADYNPGCDIVCAAVSTVTYGFINYLEDIEEYGMISDLEIVEEPGDIEIRFTVKDFDEYPQIESLILTYYQMISETYPENVKLK